MGNIHTPAYIGIKISMKKATDNRILEESDPESERIVDLLALVVSCEPSISQTLLFAERGDKR